MLYSAGGCSVCGPAGDALFVKDRASERVFFHCPSCGCAWLTPPTVYVVETADPPEKFAPQGIALPTRTEIVSQGWEEAIAEELDDEWIEFLGLD